MLRLIRSRLNLRSQVWVETAIYTLIGLTLLAIVLSVAVPQVNKSKDRSVIRQTSDSLDDLDNKILEIVEVAGNTRIFYFNFEKGRLEVNGVDDNINYILENTNLKFSEPGKNIKYRDLDILTETYGKRYTVKLLLNYKDIIDITYNDKDENKAFFGGVYKVKISNKGFDNVKNEFKINFDII